MSDLNNQLNKYTSLLYEKIIEILNYIASLYNLTVSKFNFDTSIINESISQITKFFVNIYKIVIERLNLEFNDLKLIYNSFVSSLSANGQIAALFILVLIIFFIFILIFSSGDKKTSSKTKNVKQKSVKAQLLEIEIDLLELQDKYSRKVISLNSYLAETKRLEEKANKIN
ncbi:MAG: hypothetical protein CM15mP81_01570 [Alphaproteobacteria bacterium]|nr:MAG: hypothetical protein CM15mP81_01570 [Alphaproteobacteria bacterium]